MAKRFSIKNIYFTILNLITNQKNKLMSKQKNRHEDQTEINLSGEDTKKVLDALLASQQMLKELKKQLYLNPENNVCILIEKNEKLLDEIK